MSRTDRIKLDKFDAVRGLWDAHRNILRARGVALDKVTVEWAAKQAGMLASPGAQIDFAELMRGLVQPRSQVAAMTCP